MYKYLLILVVFVAGCSIMDYQKADLSMYSGHQGYLDQQISPGIHIIEITQRGGYQFGFDNKKLLSKLAEYWDRRASELCPNGYEGESKAILALNAKIPAFQCNKNFCQGYPVVSGIVKCIDENT